MPKSVKYSRISAFNNATALTFSADTVMIVSHDTVSERADASYETGYHAGAACLEGAAEPQAFGIEGRAPVREDLYPQGIRARVLRGRRLFQL